MEITKKKSADFTRVFDIIEYQSVKYPNPAALNFFESGQWIGISISEIKSRIDAITCWLLDNNIAADDKVVLVPEMGKPEWMIIDFACQQAGLITVPIHPTAREEEIEIILAETEPRLCIAANVELHKKLSGVIERSLNIAQTYHLDKSVDGFFTPLDLSPASTERLLMLEEQKRSIREDAVFSILYTSGSSGVPKGVLLTHLNVVSNIKAVLTILPLECGNKVLSFLPFSHIFERMTCYAYMAFGASLYFSQNKESFAHDFKTVRPYFCTAVPRVLEKMYDFLEAQLLQKNFIKARVISWSLEIGKEYGSTFSQRPVFAIKLLFAKILVLHTWRKKLGGKIRYMVVGAASLRPEIGRLFSAAGIRVIEGYGMTETASLITLNRFEPGLNRFGTVGLTISGIEVMIDEPNEENEGEVLVKGPNVTQGYFNRPEISQQAFTEDGWFRTGDVGKFVHGRFLKITDRKKDIFKTSAGKYIAPGPLQNHFIRSHFIERCLIIGFHRPYLIALIVPQMEILEAWCRQEHIHWTAPQFMVHNIKVRARLQEEIDLLNSRLPNVERINNFILCHDDWSIARGELTPTLKPVRRVLEENYKGEIEKVYNR